MIAQVSRVNFDFQKIVLIASFEKPIIVEFSAPSCGPCWWMEKALANVVKKYTGRVEFISLNVNDVPYAVKSYQLKSNPTTLMIKQGKEVGRLGGALPKMVIEQWINDHL